MPVYKLNLTEEGAEVLNYIVEIDDCEGTDDTATFAILDAGRERDIEFRGRHVLEAAGRFAQWLWIGFYELGEYGGINHAHDLVELIKRIGQLLDWGWITFTEV